MAKTRSFDDVVVGETTTHGAYTVTEAEIIEFAERYDPQPFHVDPESAMETQFGGLIASGWHTVSIGQRLFVEAVLGDLAAEGSPGVENLQFRNPLRPGATVSLRITVTEKRPLESRPELGLVTFEETVRDEDGTDLISMDVHVFVKRD